MSIVIMDPPCGLAGHPIVNDPLYNHPVWQQRHKERSTEACESKSGAEHSEEEALKETGSRKMEAIVSEIIRSKFEAANRLQATEISERKSEGNQLDIRGGGEGGEVADESESLRAPGDIASDDGEENKEPSESSASVLPGLTLDENEVDPDCSECMRAREDPLPSELVMYLHALSYKVC